MITGQKVVLRDKRLTDARNDYKWKKDPELAQLDAAPQLTIGFAQFLLNYTADLHLSRSTSRQFAIETKEGKHIGNCGFYDISQIRGEAELGIIIGDRDYWGKGYGSDAVKILVDYIFRETNLSRIYLKTLTDNFRAQQCFTKSGFSQYARWEKDGYNFVLMEINRRQWREQAEKP